MTVDDQLTAALARREQALDLLVRSLVEIDTLSDRIDVLLDRRQELQHG
jgi:hypothetical protein